MQDRMKKIVSIGDVVEIERMREFVGHEPSMPGVSGLHHGS